MPVRRSTPALALGTGVLCLALAACGSGGSGQKPSSTPAAASTPQQATTGTSTAVVGSPATAPTTGYPGAGKGSSPKPSAPTSSARRSSASNAPAARSTGTGHTGHTGSALPLDLPTDGARQVITVVAPSRSSTTGQLQAWQRSGSGWTRVGPAVKADLGADGSSTSPSESRSATPIGSFTLTQAFGHDADPGTRLPYTRTTPADWWISQSGPLYNTRQRCDADCPFTQGSPNEHLYYETPDYDWAVVIDYNTRNAPGGVKQGAGSAFFLHVSEGRPTAGCVSIPAANLLRIMRWLVPGQHPRILIGP